MIFDDQLCEIDKNFEELETQQLFLTNKNQQNLAEECSLTLRLNKKQKLKYKLICPLCRGNIMPFQINMNEIIMICTNKKYIFLRFHVKQINRFEVLALYLTSNDYHNNNFFQSCQFPFNTIDPEFFKFPAKKFEEKYKAIQQYINKRLDQKQMELEFQEKRMINEIQYGKFGYCQNQNESTTTSIENDIFN